MNPVPCVIHEDEHLLVVNKPAGLNTHAPAPHAGEGIYDWLKTREPRWSRLAILHRLDKETSGILVFGKTVEANRSLTRQFTDRLVRKRYVLIVPGTVTSIQPRMESAIVRIGDRYAARPPHRGADLAETHFRILGANHRGTLIEAVPVTGRTHQIRVHAAAQNLPILGDTLYGGKAADRLFLHSEELSLEHPVTGCEVKFRAEAGFEQDPALALRSALIDAVGNSAWRILHGASDECPGWYVDRVGDYLLSQSSAETPTPEQRKRLAELLEGLDLRGAYHRQLSRRIQSTGPSLACPAWVLGQTAPGAFCITENGLQFEASFQEGYSTGLFLDQRDNRRRILKNHVGPDFPVFDADPASAEMLNVFAYSCAFSVCGARAGARVTSLDLSKKYLDWGRRNFEANGLDPGAHDFIFGDAFDWLGRLRKKGRQFDFLILDPPTFSRSKQGGVFRAESDYPRLIGAALPLLKPGGVLLASCNASEWKPALFAEMIRATIRENNRKVLNEQYVPQPPDFRITPVEPGYLKTVWVKLA